MIQAAGGNEIAAKGIGTIRGMANADGGTRSSTFHDVFVPELGVNLFSIRQATQNGKHSIINAEKCQIFDGETLCMEAKLDGNPYMLQFLPTVSSAFPLDELDLWYQRLGHVAKGTIEPMIKIGAAEGIDKNTKPDVVSCEPCIEGKHHKGSFPISFRERAKKSGERVHFDVCRPIEPETISRSKYFILLRDESTTYTHIRFVATKDKFKENVKQVLSLIKHETGNSVNYITTDNGTEFVDEELEQFSNSSSTMV